jgi:uncharacterized protein YkwD
LLIYNLDLTPGRVAEAQPGEILRQINRERMELGAPALTLDGQLSAAAQARAQQVAAAASFAERERGPEDLSRRVEEAGYEQRFVSEIVMQGDAPAEMRFGNLRESEPETFKDAMRMEYRDLGVGLARGENGLVCVLIFGLSAIDDFARKTARLSDHAKLRAEILARVNEERSARHLPPLRENALLDKTAQEHADDMIRRSYYSHDSPEGATAFDRARRAGYAALAVGENIAEGQSTPRQVMDAWMASPGHREHILGRALKEIGLGMAFGRNARGYELIWVQVFGVPSLAEPAPRYSGS